MFELDYYDNLKGAAVVPDEIKEFLDDGSKKSFGLDILLPSIRVLLYAASNEKPFFSILYEKLTKAKNLTSFFYERLKPNDLFDCLCLLGDECLYALLSKLNCPDSVLSKLHQTILEKKLEEFKTALEDGDINTSTITPICKLFHIRIRIDKFFIWFIEKAHRVDEIPDEEQQEKEGRRLLRSAVSNVQSFFKEILYNDEIVMKIVPPVLDSTDFVINSAISPSEKGFDNYSVISDHGIAEGVLIALTASHPNCKVEVSSKQEFFDFIFRMALFYYYSLKEDALVSPITLDVLREIVFVPEYESIWGKYETANGIDLLSQDLDAFSEKILLNEEQTAPQIGEPVKEEAEDTPTPGKSDFIEQEPTKEEGHLCPNSKYEFVPENYFDPECVSKGYIEEHYELVDRVKKHGLQAFVDFINYIANEGFIENDDETKALLAYRLTGRMRPEKQKLDKIKWFKEKGEPKELYYVIKYFSPRSKTKFSKQMKEYFENDYFGVDRYSRTAEDVSDGFKDKLEDWFPGLTNTSKG